MRAVVTMSVELETDECFGVTVAIYDDSGAHLDTQRLSRRNVTMRTPQRNLEVGLSVARRAVLESVPPDDPQF